MNKCIALLALLLGLTACTQGQWFQPFPTPPGPGPGPGPVTPVPPVPPTPPAPTPPAGITSWENSQKVKVGMTHAEVNTALGVAPTFESVQDDGTTLADWASLDETGKPEYLSVHFGKDGKVMGRARVPRAVPAATPSAPTPPEPMVPPAKAPPLPVAFLSPSLEDDEITVPQVCDDDGNCGVPRR